MLCLDDRDDTYSENTQNGMCIPEYSPKPERDAILDDNCLSVLMEWLKANQNGDVRKLKKKTIFY